MNRAVIFHKEAKGELEALYRYIADENGPERAWNYISGIRDFCNQLHLFPKRGTDRREIAAGLRVIGYRRRCSIVFTVNDTAIIILGIFYGGRNISPRTLKRRMRSS